MLLILNNNCKLSQHALPSNLLNLNFVVKILRAKCHQRFCFNYGNLFDLLYHRVASIF